VKRRTFLQSLSALFLPRIRVPAQPPGDPPTYTDSDGRTPAELASLHDGDTAQGGVTYQP
jgi:hypothetical protein